MMKQLLLTLLLFPFLLNASAQEVSDTTFVDLSELSNAFAYDMRYATENNFLKEQVYDCPKCLLRKEAADALIKANELFREKGYRIKLFDCYRPLDIQKKMWEIYPNATYVANPYKSGSIHNRGLAVDLTIEKLDGTSVEMGTDFDFFGEAAHHDYNKLPYEVIENRLLLKNTLESVGFRPISSEWWHYNFNSPNKYVPANTPLDCN
ncbi:M15 family metallopeptidase [Limibacter armeniacum]|uniref:M15 family metallopeptidase n=1 Tax=Limibacter armeniacum TaxID=466084 RepID=UPI002FE56DA4